MSGYERVSVPATCDADGGGSRSRHAPAESRSIPVAVSVPRGHRSQARRPARTRFGLAAAPATAGGDGLDWRWGRRLRAVARPFRGAGELASRGGGFGEGVENLHLFHGSDITLATVRRDGQNFFGCLVEFCLHAS